METKKRLQYVFILFHPKRKETSGMPYIGGCLLSFGSNTIWRKMFCLLFCGSVTNKLQVFLWIYIVKGNVSRNMEIFLISIGGYLFNAYDFHKINVYFYVIHIIQQTCFAFVAESTSYRLYSTIKSSKQQFHLRVTVIAAFAQTD